MKETKSSKAKGNSLSESSVQLQVLSRCPSEHGLPSFTERLKDVGLMPLKPTGIEVLQINVGKMCNQVCAHCHVDAGPDRKEIMNRDTMRQCVEVMRNNPDLTTIDLTGGAPEMNPDFRWFVEQIKATRPDVNIIVRSNLTIIVANKKYYDLPEFFKKHHIEVSSSLPYFSASRTDAQRGDGVFNASIQALTMLNEAGYGKADSGLILNLVYNPTGAFLPDDQEALERQFKQELKRRFSIDFNKLFAITNLPVSRFLEYLVNSGNYEEYMEKLVQAFNPVAAANVMCRNTISVGWDGYLYDCDFNQMLEMKVAPKSSQHIRDYDTQLLEERSILLNQHCYGCTAGAGSSCGGTTS